MKDKAKKKRRGVQNKDYVRKGEAETQAPTMAYSSVSYSLRHTFVLVFLMNNMLVLSYDLLRPKKYFPDTDVQIDKTQQEFDKKLCK